MCTKAELHKRIREVSKLLCIGKTRADILQFSADRWGLKERQSDEYIAEATKQLQEIGNVDLETEKGKALERAMLVFQQSLKANQYRNALSANEQIIKLHGLYAPEKQEHSGTLDVRKRIIIDGIEMDTDKVGGNDTNDGSDEQV
jgi:hypothetical protein